MRFFAPVSRKIKLKYPNNDNRSNQIGDRIRAPLVPDAKAARHSPALQNVVDGRRQPGAVIECLSYIGAHKEHGGPIRVKNKSYLTIPISELAYGKTAEEVEMNGIELFRPGPPGAKKNLLAYADENGNLVPVFALCKQTRPQRADKWWPEDYWVLEQGIREAKWHIERGH